LAQLVSPKVPPMIDIITVLENKLNADEKKMFKIFNCSKEAVSYIFCNYVHVAYEMC